MTPLGRDELPYVAEQGSICLIFNPKFPTVATYTPAFYKTSQSSNPARRELTLHPHQLTMTPFLGILPNRHTSEPSTMLPVSYRVHDAVAPNAES